jgi:tryptophan-rich sensory protein
VILIGFSVFKIKKSFALKNRGMIIDNNNDWAVSMKNKNYLALIIWTLGLIAIGGIIGSLTKPEIGVWYSALHRSTLTPPNYVFPVAWTILYATIGTCGWLIWGKSQFPRLNVIKTLYLAQLILNWSWTPLFFHYHLTGLSMIVLGVMDILVSALVWLACRKMKAVSLLMLPYLLWILFASYLNFYIWLYN